VDVIFPYFHSWSYIKTEDLKLCIEKSVLSSSRRSNLGLSEWEWDHHLFDLQTNIFFCFPPSKMHLKVCTCTHTHKQQPDSQNYLVSGLTFLIFMLYHKCGRVCSVNIKIIVFNFLKWNCKLKWRTQLPCCNFNSRQTNCLFESWSRSASFELYSQFELCSVESKASKSQLPLHILWPKKIGWLLWWELHASSCSK
jgi:hypothetical protein